MLKLIIILFITLSKFGHSAKPKRVTVLYPIELLQPVIGNHFEGTLTRDSLTCFGNRDHNGPTFEETFGCIFGLPGFSCTSIWGSRSVIVEADGSVEFLRVNRLPMESSGTQSQLHAHRWLVLASGQRKKQKEVKQVPIEPLYLCARSNDWRWNSTASINVQFRPTYFREWDRTQCLRKGLLHLLMLLVLSSALLFPYLLAMLSGTVAFVGGMNYYLYFLLVSCCIVLFAPIMFTRKNRLITRTYFKYLLTRIQVRMVSNTLKAIHVTLLFALFVSFLYPYL